MECDHDIDLMIKRMNEVCINIEPHEARNSRAMVPYDHTKNGAPQSSDQRAEFLVSEMMSATSVDEAKFRAARVLESERTEATRNLEQENIMLKQQLNMALERNANVERAFESFKQDVMQQLMAVRYEYENDRYRRDQFATTLMEVIY